MATEHLKCANNVTEIKFSILFNLNLNVNSHRIVATILDNASLESPPDYLPNYPSSLCSLITSPERSILIVGDFLVYVKCLHLLSKQVS